MSMGKLIWQISLDSSGVTSEKHHAIGAIWMKYQRRGDFAREIRHLKEKYQFEKLITWQDVEESKNLPFYKSLLVFFIKSPWLVFHGVLERNSLAQDNQPSVLSRKVFQTMLVNLISTKVNHIITTNSQRQCEFRLELTPVSASDLNDSKKQASENNVVLSQNTSLKSQQLKPITESIHIQFANFLMQAMVTSFNSDENSAGEKIIHNIISQYIGWPDLLARTSITETKFNIWHNNLMPHEKAIIPQRSIELAESIIDVQIPTLPLPSNQNEPVTVDEPRQISGNKKGRFSDLFRETN